MRRIKLAFWGVVVLMLIGFVGVSLRGKAKQKDMSNISKVSEMQGESGARYRSLQKALAEKIVGLYTWEVDVNTNLWLVLNNSEASQYIGEPSTSLSIYDKQGKVVYESNGVTVHSISRQYLLRSARPQLVIEVNSGGKTNSLLILDYQDGSVVSLLKDNYYEIYALIKPQFSEGVNPAEVAYEILLTDGVGLPSPLDKVTRIYRYSDGEYRLVGKLQQKQIDSFIENLLRKK